MVFYLIGLGLGSPDDITVKGLNALKTCSFVFLEHYTSILCDTTTEELENYYNKQLNDKKMKIVLADRLMVEQNSNKILNIDGCIHKNTAFLVVGDPFAATTHTDLLLRAAKNQNIECVVIHNASIMNAVSCCGLQLYSFGATVSIPFWTETWKPYSFYDKIKKNKDIGLHTLCLLDIKVKEISETNLLKGINKYEKPRFMTIHICIKQLLQIEKEQHQNVYDENTKCVGLARIGSKTQLIAYGTMAELSVVDFGKPLHSFVIPGNTHFFEENVLKMYALNGDNKEEIQKEEKTAEYGNDSEWIGIDFNGIWQLEKSDNLNDYLLSEGLSLSMRKAAAKLSITQQVIQNGDNIKIKIFSKNGSYLYDMVINGDCVRYRDLNGDDCESIAKWSDNRKFIMETISKKSQLTKAEREYTSIRGITEDNRNEMTLQYINERGSTVTRYFTKQ